VRKLGLVAAALVAVAVVGVAPAAAPRLAPHVYVATITGARPAALNGTWRLAVVNPSFSLRKDGALAVIGTVTIAGSRVTFRDAAGPLACRGTQKSGTYTWRLRGRRLTFTRFSDTCGGRPLVLSRPFVQTA
jgi:hypothetical protein